MPSTATSILDGLSASVAVKAPCRTVATSNITLSGLQTISGYTTVEGDRVLVIAQTSAVDNGIYSASSGSWTRTKDADGNRDLVQGTRVIVRSATADGVEYELTTANPIVIGTSSLTFTLRYGANATYDQTSAEIAAGVTPINEQYPELHAFRYMSTAQIADVTQRAGLVDVREALQNAINVAQEVGGTVYCPAGSYLIRRTAGGDSQFNGLHIPYTGVFTYDEHMVLLGDGRATVFLAGDNSMTVIRLSDSRTKLTDFAIDANSKTGITGLSLLGSDTSDTSLAEHIDWNIIAGLDIVGCAEGIEMESPSAGGCYYNRFERLRLYTNTRHIRMRDNAQSGGTNRNTFIGINISGGNTGVWIDGADTNQFIACTFEEVQNGTSPNASPTAVWINLQGTALGLLSQDNNFIGCMFEDCTVDINTANRRVSIVGGNCGAVGTITAANGIDLIVGGDEQYLMRSLQLGSANVTGLLLQPSTIAYQTQGQIGTSSNQSGAYPFNGDGHLIIQSRQSNSHDITVRTGATSLERVRIDGNGHTSIISGDFSLGMDNGGAITNGATITTAGVRTVRVNPGGNVTGIILQAGTQPGQKIEVINEAGSFTVTFAAYATSLVADGTAAVIAANRAMYFTWNSSASGWYRS